MPGFYGIVGERQGRDFRNPEIPGAGYAALVCDEKKGSRYYFRRTVIPKFLGDKVFDEDAATVIGTDGLLMNARQLREKYGARTNFALIERLYADHGITGISSLKGHFSGFLLDKKTDVLHVFTDHIGTKNVFYFSDEKGKCLIFGSELKHVIAGMRDLGYTPTLSEKGALCLLTFGFMIGDTTLVHEIRKIPPGSILTWSGGQITIDRYYSFTCTPVITDSDETIIQTLESLYADAVRLEYEKDREYSYTHIATLSGGLDSRMAVMHAKKLGYSDILCLCFSQSNYLDEMIAKKIAADQGFDFCLHTLDNGNFLRNIDGVVFANDGLTFFAGSAHLHSTLQLLDWRKCGLLHGGDLWFGPWNDFGGGYHPSVNRAVIEQIAYSTKLLDDSRIRELVHPDQYENEEIFCLYERGTNCCFNGYRITEQFTEFSSPLHDRDFLAYALRLPPREDNYFFRKWILSEIPEAAEYPWEKTGVRIDAGLPMRALSMVSRLLRGKIFGITGKESMNPTEYWYRTNPHLRAYIESYYDAHIGLLDRYPTLLADAQRLYTEGTLLEKTQVLTLIAAMKLHSL